MIYPPIKNTPHLIFLAIYQIVFIDGFKVIHHFHVTREIHGYAHNFCNKQVRELTEKSGQYISCIFHNGFRFDMTFLTKGIWLSLWQTRDVSLLGSGLTTLKSYIIGRYVKFIDLARYYQQPLSKLARSTTSEEKIRIECLFLEFLGFQHPHYSKLIDLARYYQQPLSKLARSTTSEEKIRIECLFLEFLGFQHPHYSKFFLQELSEDDCNYVLQHLSLGKGCFPYESVTGFNSLSASPDDGDFWTID